MFGKNKSNQRLKLIGKISVIVVVLVALVSTATYWIIRRPFIDDYEIVDQLGGNLFPSAILSVATTNAEIIEPMEGNCLGNPKASLAIRLTPSRSNAVVRIELAETPFFARSVSSFVLPEKGKEYIIYPDILWHYDALRNNVQAEPISVAINV